MKKTRLSLTWFIPIFVVGFFLFTPFSSLAATSHTATILKPTNAGVINCVSSDYLKIWYNNGQSLICYAGNGYTGAALSGITEVDPGNNCGWVLAYWNGKSYHQSFDTDGSNYLLWNNITQIEIQGQYCNGNLPAVSRATSLRSTRSHSVTGQTPTTAQALVPNIGSGPCRSSDFLKVWYNNGHSLICYSGSGYIGAALSDVTEVDPGNNCGWFLAYLNGYSSYYQLNSYGAYYTGSTYAFNTVTQIKIQGQVCNGSLP